MKAQHASPTTFVQFIAGGIYDKFGHHNPNMIMVGDGTKPLTRDQILQAGAEAAEREGKKVAIIFAHGNVRKRGTTNEHHAQGNWINENNETIHPGRDTTREGFANSTADNILLTMEAVHPSHIDIMSCHSGAVKHDVKRNLSAIAEKMKAQGQRDLTICEISSGKYESDPLVVGSYIGDALDNPNKDEAQWIQRVRGATKIAETLTMQRIIIGDDGTPKLLSFKIKAPKTLDSIKYPETFIGSCAEYGDKKLDKESRREAQVVTIEGQKGDKDYDGMLAQIRETLLEGGQKYSQEYAMSAYKVACNRNKAELIDPWLERIDPQDDFKPELFITKAIMNLEDEDGQHFVEALADLKLVDKSSFSKQALDYGVKNKLPEVMRKFPMGGERALALLDKARIPSDLKFLIDSGVDLGIMVVSQGDDEKFMEDIRWCDKALFEQVTKEKPDLKTLGILLEDGADVNAHRSVLVNIFKMTTAHEKLLDVATPETKAFIETKMAEIATKKAAQEIGQGLQGLVGGVAAHGVLLAKPREVGVRAGRG